MSCIPVNIDYLLSKTWTREMIANEIARLDVEECPTYDADLSYYKNAIENPHTQRFYLFDKETNKIQGYLSLWCLSDEYFEKVANGTFKDDELTKGIVPFNGEVCIYIAGFVISKNYRSDHTNFKKLLAVFVEFLSQLLSKGVVIKEMVTRGLTPLGQQLCEGLGMTKIISHREKGIIYGVSFDWKEKPKYASALYDAVQKTKAKRLLNQLVGLDKKTGVPLVKEALTNWGYNVDNI